MRFGKSFSVFLAVLLLASFLAVFCFVVPVYAATVFSDNFESGNLSAWSGTAVSNGGTVGGNGTAYPHHGTYHLWSYIPAGAAAGTFAETYYGSMAGAYSTLYARVQNLRVDVLPEDTGDPYYIFGFFENTGATAISRMGMIKNGVGDYKWLIRGLNYSTTFTTWQGTSSPAANTNYCVEIQITIHASAGIYRLWVDGVLEVEVTGLDNDARGLNYCVLGQISSTSPDLTALNTYADCFILSTTYNGPEDAVKPTYSNINTNSTTRNTVCNFSATLADTVALANYTFGTNNTGAWVNDTAVTISGTTYYANATKTLNASVGIVVQWEYWFADAMNNLNNTGVLSNTTTLLASAAVLSQAIHPSFALANKWTAKAALSRTVTEGFSLATQSAFKPSLSQTMHGSWGVSDKWTAKAALAQTLGTAWSAAAGWAAKVNLAESFNSAFMFVGGWIAHTLGFAGGVSTSWGAGLGQGLNVGLSQTVSGGWSLGAGWTSTVGLSQILGTSWSSLSGWTARAGFAQEFVAEWSVMTELSHMGQYILVFSLPFSSSWNTLAGWSSGVGFVQSLTGGWNLLAPWSGNVGFSQLISTEWLTVSQWIGQAQLSEQVFSGWTSTLHLITGSQLSCSLSAGLNNFEQLTAQAIFTSPIATAWSSLSSWTANVGLIETVGSSWAIVANLFHTGTFIVNFNQPVSVSWFSIAQWSSSVELFQVVHASWLTQLVHMTVYGIGSDEFLVLGLFGMVLVAVPSLAIGLVIRRRKEK